jgi:hypothetical protein
MRAVSTCLDRLPEDGAAGLNYVVVNTYGVELCYDCIVLFFY